MSIPKDVAPYGPIEVKVIDTSFINNETLDEENEACLFKGTFYDKNTKKVGIMPPDSFFQVQKDIECQKVFSKVGLDGYYKLQP